MMRASELACRSLRLAPQGAIHRGPDGICAFCGRTIRDGEHAEPLRDSLSKSFTDFTHLVQTGQHLCGWCLTASEQTTLRNFQRSVATLDGVYGLGKDENRAWFFLTPPKPPFVAVINHSTLACFHYLWRTPVTLSEQLIHINVDGMNLTVNRASVLKAIEWTQRMSDALLAEGAKQGLSTPFMVLIRNAYRTGALKHGHIRREVLELVQRQPKFQAALDHLSNLSPGDLFALSSITKQKPITPQATELQTQPK